MSEARYTFTCTPRDDDQLHVEVAALGITGFLGVCGSGAEVQVMFAAPISPADQVQVSAAVADHTPAPDAAAKRVRSAASLLFSAPDRAAQIDRAVALVVMDELNLLRAWITSFKAAVAAASSLADLKTRVAALPDTPNRNASQIKGAVGAKINHADAD